MESKSQKAIQMHWLKWRGKGRYEDAHDTQTSQSDLSFSLVKLLI